MHVNQRVRHLKIYASIIDLAICLILSAIVIVPTSINFASLTEVSAADITLLVLSIFMGFVLSVLYLFIPSLFMKGYTIGMRIFNIRFFDKDGNPLSITKMLFRAFIVSLASFITAGIGLIINLILVCTRDDIKTFYDVFISSSCDLVELEVQD